MIQSKPTTKTERQLLYLLWWAMIDRCHNPENEVFNRYGGRGIKVCDSWRCSFDAFLKDIGPRPSRSHSVDRKDNDAGYSKENCHWATPAQQTRNKRSNIWVTYGGETLILKDMAKKHGVLYCVLYDRVVTHGWDIKSAIERPVQRGGDRRGYHPANN